MPTQTPRGLERDVLVARMVHAIAPPKVVYSSTPLCRTLVEPLGALGRWVERHQGELEAARKRHGARKVAPDRSRPR